MKTDWQSILSSRFTEAAAWRKDDRKRIVKDVISELPDPPGSLGYKQDLCDIHDAWEKLEADVPKAQGTDVLTAPPAQSLSSKVQGRFSPSHRTIASVAAILGTIGLTLDFLTPVFPFQIVFIVIGLLVFLMADKIDNLFDNHDAPIVRKVGGFMAIVGGALLGLAHLFPGGKETGALAQIIPPVETAQARLLNEVEGLRQDTRDVADSVDRVGETVDEVLVVTRGLKRETSEDPRKELANIGVSWSEGDFYSRITNGDTRAVALYLAGGMRVSPYIMETFMVGDVVPMSFIDYWSDEVADVLLAWPERQSPELCRPVHSAGRALDTPGAPVHVVGGRFWSVLSDEPERLAFFTEICDAQALRRHITALIDLEHDRVARGQEPGIRDFRPELTVFRGRL